MNYLKYVSMRSMKELDCILEQIIIKVFVEMQQEMHWDFLGVNHLLGGEGTVFTVSVEMVGFDHGWAVPGGEVEMIGIASWLPGLPVNDLFGFVIDVVDWGGLHLSFLMSEGVEDRDAADGEAVSQLVVVAEAVGFNVEGVLGFSDGGLVIAKGGINNVIIVENAIFIFAFFLVIHLVGKCNQPIDLGLDLPEVWDLELDISDSVLSSDVDPGLDLIVGSLGVSLEIEVGEDQLLIVLIFPDGNLRVVVHFVVEVFVGPFVVFGLPAGYGFWWLINAMVVKISKDESVVVEASPFADTEVFGFREGPHLHGAGVIVGVEVVDLEDLVGLQVDDVDFGLGDVADDHLFVVDLSEEVDDVAVCLFVENFARCIAMDDAFLGSWLVHADENKSSFVGGRSAEDLRELALEFDGVLVSEQHILKN